ncbi:hypothetical protein P171DRAFT_427418 [Karstenula rhodostoma CBS 690.94]|uniref:Uncharacterized protein n=1 Tax=Karstenula rhodostoma CBS 690.94 TaxID=1392251 RepID=A0A9P4UHD2_9PLEO|nr:hypothetical protein P171DRAFT_427418 [Karstenula rhodostoma CBS 690.94]
MPAPPSPHDAAVLYLHSHIPRNLQVPAHREQSRDSAVAECCVMSLSWRRSQPRSWYVCCRSVH